MDVRVQLNSEIVTKFGSKINLQVILKLVQIFCISSIWRYLQIGILMILATHFHILNLVQSSLRVLTPVAEHFEYGSIFYYGSHISLLSDINYFKDFTNIFNGFRRFLTETARKADDF